MALAGGAASKAGNRYERHWIILKLIEVLEGKAQSVQPEVPGPDGDGTDMLVIEDGQEVWHQVKNQPGSDAWTITRLAHAGVLTTCLAKIKAGGRFVLDSGTGAQQLADLANGAARCESWPEFNTAYLATSQDRQAWFGKLCDAWDNTAPEAAYQALRQVTVNAIAEEALRDLVMARLTALVDGRPENAVVVLQDLVDSSTHRRLTASDIWACLASSGIRQRRTHVLTPRRWAALAASVAVIVAAAIVVPILLKPAPANPWQRLPVQPLGNGYPQQPDTVTVPASSLSRDVAQLLRKRIAAGTAITGYRLRNAYPTTIPGSTASYCLTAKTTGSKAGIDGDPVEATTCTPGALSQVWIPAQYEASGTTYTWLVNGQYPSMCLNANSSGGGVHQRSGVQLWQCYWRHGASPTSFVESWDFGTWLHAIKSGAKSCPLFPGSGNFSVDADDHSLQNGFDTVSVSMINHYTVPWEYWY
jgi:hypothetical protein